MGQVHCLKFASGSIERKDSQETQDDASTPMIKSHSSRRIGCGAQKDVCQDVILNMYDFGEDTHFYAIFDGFGPKGKEIAEFLRDTFQYELEMRKKVIKVSSSNKEIEKDLRDMIKVVDAKLKGGKIDISVSGSCMLGILIIKSKCIIISLGNSVAAKCIGDAQKSETIQLSKSHTLVNSVERQRIEKLGAKFDKLKTRAGEYYGFERYWVDDNGPGFVSTRGFGGTNFKRALITEPEIKFDQLSVLDRFIIIASDGLWDVMKFEEISDFYFQTEIEPDRNLAEIIIKEASKKWDAQLKRPKEYQVGIGDDPKINVGSDDISVIMLQLQFPSRSGGENQ